MEKLQQLKYSMEKMKQLGAWLAAQWRRLGQWIFPHLRKEVSKLQAKVNTQAGLIAKQYTQTCELKKDIIVAAEKYQKIEEENSKLRGENSKLSIRNVILESKS